MDRSNKRLIVLLAVVLLVLHLYNSFGRRLTTAHHHSQFGTLGVRYIQLIGESADCPGIYTFYSEPTVKELFERAGASKYPLLSDKILNQRITTGTKVIIGRQGESAQVHLVPMTNSERFLLGIPMPVNSVTQSDLDLIPGVGPHLASRIIAFRNTRGPLQNVAELGQVPGIGEIKFKKISPYLADN